MKKITTIIIPALKGNRTIARAEDVFTSYIDHDFEKWGTDKRGVKTDEVKLDVFEMTENATFAQIFTKPDEMCLTQDQIIEFCQKHKEDLSQSWNTFFLFMVDSEFFVAYVYVDASGRLRAFVYEFSRGFVWRADGRRRFVLPQLATSTSETDPLTLKSFVSELKTLINKYEN